MLSRKYNVDIIIIAQLERMIDIYLRELSKFIFVMDSRFIREDYLMFGCTVKQVSKTDYKTYIRNTLDIDLIEGLRVLKLEYNTLDKSEIKKITRKQEIQQEERDKKQEIRRRKLSDKAKKQLEKDKKLVDTEEGGDYLDVLLGV